MPALLTVAFVVDERFGALGTRCNYFDDALGAFGGRQALALSLRLSMQRFCCGAQRLGNGRAHHAVAVVVADDLFVYVGARGEGDAEVIGIEKRGTTLMDAIGDETMSCRARFMDTASPPIGYIRATCC